MELLLVLECCSLLPVWLPVSYRTIWLAVFGKRWVGEGKGREGGGKGRLWRYDTVLASYRYSQTHDVCEHNCYCIRAKNLPEPHDFGDMQ